MQEPSVLLIDDEERHEVYLRMLGLESREEEWIVKAAIDKTLEGAVHKAIEEIEANGGFTVLIVDIIWPTDDKGGVKILNELSKRYGRNLPVRRGIIMSRESITNDPELMRLAEVLKMKREWWTLQLITPQTRERLEKVLLEIWDEVKPKKGKAK